MLDPKPKILKVALPAELYEQLEAAAVADDRELDRFVVRMVKRYLAAPGSFFVPATPASPAVFVPGIPSAGPTIFPTAPMAPTNPVQPGRAIPLATKGGAEGVPIDLMSDNALNGEPEELVNPMAPKVVVPRPNPNAPDMFGSTHKKI